MSDPDLFGGEGGGEEPPDEDVVPYGGGGEDGPAPLAARMRPRSLDEFRGPAV
jgi:hypothetical protein